MNRDLTVGSVHIWSIALQSGAPPQDHSCLDVDERQRAAAFKFDSDRWQFVAAHVAMRSVLGDYCGIAPAQVPLQRDHNDKPALPSSYSLRFNLSHSADLALLAVGHDIELGVDLEKIQPLSDAAALAKRHFSPTERAMLLREPPGAARDHAFLQCWTRKEAYAKSSGIGLRTDLRAIEAGFDGRNVVGTTTILPLEAGPAFVAALAANGPLNEVRQFRFT